MMPPSRDAIADSGAALLHVFSTFAVGGQQTRFAAIVNHFGRRYRHLVIAMDANYACRERLAPGLDIAFPSIPRDVAGTLANLARWRAALRRLRPDLLVTYNWGAIEWAMANAPVPLVSTPLVPHIHIEDGFGREERSRQLRRRSVVRQLYLRRSTLVVPSQRLQRIAVEAWRLDPSRVVYIPNGIDTGIPSQATASPLPWADGRPVIGTVTALRPEKNLGRLLRAFRRVIDQMPARLVIVGDGPERPDLEKLAHELELETVVHFLGHVVQPQGLYPKFDVFALSSDTEQMPITVLEAMAAGLPVVAPDVGDIRGMVSTENEPLIAGKDDEALAASLLRVLRDADFRRRTGSGNRTKAVRDFRLDVMFEAYRDLFDETSFGPQARSTHRPWPNLREGRMIEEPWPWKG